MTDFKFPCPHCGQHIQASEAYSGMQINCPACQKPMVVPRAPGSAPAATPPPAPAAPRAQTPPPPPPPAPQRPIPSVAPVAPASKSSKMLWVVVGSVTALAAIGVGVFFYLQNGSSGEKAAAKPAAQASQPTTAPASETKSLTASEIIQKVTDQYSTMTSFSAKGSAISIMDMSHVDMKALTAGAKMPAGASKEAKEALSKPITMECDFSVKLGKENFYCVEWENKVNVTAPSKMPAPVMKGAIWSQGDGDFFTMNPKKYAKIGTRDQALAMATGVSGGVAATMPSIFFGTMSSPLNLMNDPELGDEETIDGEDCYVLNGKAMGMKTVLWITKSNFLIKQKQTILGGDMEIPKVSDAEMDKQLKSMNLTPAQREQAKAAAKNMKPMMSQMKGTMTETYQNIEINKPAKKEDFAYPLPQGAVLSPNAF